MTSKEFNLNDLSREIEAEDNEAEEEIFTQDFVSLAELGALEEDYFYCGHKFTLKTPTIEEEIAVGRISAKYPENSLAQYKATLTASVACSLVAINDSIWMPRLGGDTSSWLLDRYNTIQKLYAPVVDFLYSKFAELIQRRDIEQRKLEKKYESGIEESATTPAAWKEGDSSEET